MKFKDLHPPILELAPGQTFHPVQLTRARKTSVRINGLLLAPTGLQSGRLRLTDVRALAEPYPVLQAQRITVTQGFAQECRAQQLDGIVYASAQHPLHACVALFESGMAQVKKVSSLPLVKSCTKQLLTCVTDAARRSGVPLMDFADME